MPDVVINFLNNLHDIDEAGNESDINFQIERVDKREIDGIPEEPDIIEQAEAPIGTTSDGVGLEGVADSDASQPEDNAGSGNTSKDDQLESYEPRRDGLRSARAKPGRYTRKEVGMHLLRDPDTSYRRDYGFYMKPEQTINKLGIVGKGSVVKEVKQLLERKSWQGVHISKIPKEEPMRISIPCKMLVKEKFTASGAFDTIKYRLVAGGHRQNAKLYKTLAIQNMLVQMEN
eukprot:gene594-biopygen636